MPPLPLLHKPSPPTAPADPGLRSARQPLLWAALAYSAGIIAGIYAWRPASWWIFAATVFFLSGLFFLRRRRWLGASLALGAFFLAGALQIQLRGFKPLVDTGLLPYADGQTIELTAHVIREGRLRQQSPGENQP